MESGLAPEVGDEGGWEIREGGYVCREKETLRGREKVFAGDVVCDCTEEGDECPAMGGSKERKKGWERSFKERYRLAIEEVTDKCKSFRGIVGGGEGYDGGDLLGERGGG